MKPGQNNGRRNIGSGILLVLLAVGGGLVWFLEHRHRIAVDGIPPRPAATLPVTLQDRLADAEQAAQGLRNPVRGLAVLSRLYHANGYYDEAMQGYAVLQRLEPREARWPHLLGGILAEFGRLDEALGPRRQAVALAPAYLPARLRLGDILLKGNQPAAAATAYAGALKLEANNPYALLGLARCAMAGGDWDKAREYLRQAVRQHPGFYGAMTQLVTVHEHFGEMAEADATRAALGRQEFVDLSDPWMEELSEDCFDPYRLSVSAAVARSTGDAARARHLLERAIALAPDSASYHRQLGELLAQGGDNAGARRQFEAAVALAAGEADAWIQLFQLFKTTGELGAAQRVLATALEHCPTSPTLHLENARLLSAAGRSREAIDEFRASDRLRPSEASPLVELAGELFKVNQSEAALAALHEGLRRQPEHPMILATLTLYAVSTGDENGARLWWARVQQQPSTPPPVVSTIRQAYQQRFGHSLD